MKMTMKFTRHAAKEARDEAIVARQQASTVNSKVNEVENRMNNLEKQFPDLKKNANEARKDTANEPQAARRARSVGYRISEDEEQRRLRTAVVTGWPKDCFAKDIKSYLQALLDSSEDKPEVVISTPGRICSMAFLEFRDEESLIDYLKKHDSNPFKKDEMASYLRPNKTPDERKTWQVHQKILVILAF